MLEMEGEPRIEWEISEEEELMVDSVFLKCDTNQTGHVCVKTIIQYLKTCLGNESNEPDLSELSCILQESCADGSIDLASYRTGVQLWIISIRNRCERFPVMETDTSLLSPPGCHNHPDSLKSDDLSIETSSIGDGLFTKSEQDLGELLGEVQDLKYQNSRLMEDKERLHEQLISQEEAASQLTMQLDSHIRDEDQMRKKIKCLQDIGSLHEMAVDEIVELKSQLSQLQGTRRELDGQVTSLERENANLESQARHFENKWQKSTKELDGIKKRVDQLQDTCEKQKELLLQSEELKCVNEEDVLKKSKEVEDLTDRVKTILRQNEKLLEEKSEVQDKLAEANAKLLGFHQADSLGLDNQSFVDDNQHSEAAKLLPKQCFSTPLPKHSICMELKDRLNEDRHLPSPLCEKFELSSEVLGYRSAVLPTYMSAWELDSPSMSQQEFSIDMFKREPFNSEKYDFDIEKKLSGLKNMEKDALQKEIIQLYRVNVSLAEKCHKAELKEAELESAANEASEMAAADRHKCQQLQESLDGSRIAQQVELKDLWRLVHSVEEEDDTQESYALSVTTEQLKQQIRDDIDALKNKLHTRKAALSILRSEVYQNQYKGKSSSSPLVDALDLDRVAASNRSRYEDSQSSICCHSPSLLNRYSPALSTEDIQVIPDTHVSHTTRYSRTSSQADSQRSHQPASDTSSHLDSQAEQLDSQTSNQAHSHTDSQLEPRTASHLEGHPVGQLDSWSSNQAASQPSLSPPEVWTLSGSSGETDLSAVSRDSGHSNSIIDFEMRAPIPEMEDSSGQSKQNSFSGLAAVPSSPHSPSLSSSSCSRSADLSSMSSTSSDTRPSATASKDGNAGSTHTKLASNSPRTSSIRSNWLGADSARNMSPSERILQHNADKQSASSVIKTSELSSKASMVVSEKCSQSVVRDLQLEECEAVKLVMDSDKHSSMEMIEIETVQDSKHSSSAPGASGSDSGTESSSPSQVEEGSMKGPGMMNLQQQQQQQQHQQHHQTTAAHRSQGVNALKGLGAEDGMVSRGKGSDKDVSKAASHLTKIRQNHLAKRRDNTLLGKMPELSELAEKEPADGNGAIVSEKPSNGQQKEGVIMPPPPSEDEVLPSIPDEYLRELGVTADNDDSCDELSEQEIESKFSSLSLAFKTDAQTLEKRLEIQERARDIAEQNVDKELQGLRSGLATLNQICTDPVVREVLTKIQTHIDVLERSTARVSSRAEVFGAIQQEKRMSKAVDIMIHHVENLRRVHEREHAELEEARKLLQDSRSLGPSPLVDMAGGEMLSRRSASVCPNNMFSGGKSALGVPGSVSPSALKAMKLLKASRRRVSEIALPKVLGGSGAPNLQLSASMDHCFTDPRLPRVNSSLRADSILDDDDEDPRSRFQAVVASTTVKSAVANTLRRASLEKQNNVQTISPTVTPPQVSRDDSTDSAKITDSQDKEKQKNLEEEAFKKGYEQGMRASLGQDLSSLREQQNQINESLGEIMDTIDSNNEEPKNLREILLERFHDNMPTVKISGWRIRLTMGCFFIMMAFISVIISLLPVTSADILHYRHVGPPVL